jgi:hypothetical protein
VKRIRIQEFFKVAKKTFEGETNPRPLDDGFNIFFNHLIFVLDCYLPEKDAPAFGTEAYDEAVKELEGILCIDHGEPLRRRIQKLSTGRKRRRLG